MLAELAAANAAFAIIKEAVANAGDIAAAGQKLYEYFDAKSAIQRKYEEKAKGSKSSDLEEFMALEQLKNQEDELKQMMIYHGRAGLWTDWLRFQSQAKRKREEAKKQELAAAARRKEAIVNSALWTFAAALLGVLLGVGFWLFNFVKERG